MVPPKRFVHQGRAITARQTSLLTTRGSETSHRVPRMRRRSAAVARWVDRIPVEISSAD